MSLTFTTVHEWDNWLSERGGATHEAWLVVTRKGHPGLTAAEAGDVAICHGWIDGRRRALDAGSFLQRYSPRRPGSPWSRVNVERVAALTAAERMRPAGLAQVAAAHADGRWSAAYEPQRTAKTPPELTAALQTDPAAGAAFAAMTRGQRYNVFLPLLKARTPAARETALRRALAACR
jgi:uncharacterized protein YdeI (YjbR/CyaY-like superfamily)